MSHIRWSTTGLVCNIVAERANNDYDEKAAPSQFALELHGSIQLIEDMRQVRD